MQSDGYRIQDAKERLWKNGSVKDVNTTLLHFTSICSEKTPLMSESLVCEWRCRFQEEGEVRVGAGGSWGLKDSSASHDLNEVGGFVRPSDPGGCVVWSWRNIKVFMLKSSWKGLSWQTGPRRRARLTVTLKRVKTAFRNRTGLEQTVKKQINK